MRHLFRERPHFQRPQLPFRHRPAVAANLWVRCERCNELLYVREYEENLKVCPKCEHHARLAARERIEHLLDPGTWAEEDTHLLATDPLRFVSLGQGYPDKVAETREKTGLEEAMLCGRGAIDGLRLRLAVCDFAFMGASMGSVVGEKLARAVERCLDERVPLVAVATSGGARMHEGVFALMQMAKTASALARLGEARLPFISILADPTTGGVTASWAGLGDVLIGEPGALIGFAGPRVIEQITKQKLPPDAQRSEFLLQHGMLDMVVSRRELRPTLARLLRLYSGAGETRVDAADAGVRQAEDRHEPDPRSPEPPRGYPPLPDTPAPPNHPEGTRRSQNSAWDRVRLARHPERPYTLDYIRLIFDDFVELHGDRLFAEDAALIGGLASLDGRIVMVLGQQKGRDTKENQLRRFGMARPEGYRKALRLMEQAARFGLPLISFVDTPGADPTLPSEERGQALAIATNLLAMARLETPSVAVVIGEGGSGGAIAIGLADRMLMLENAIYSVAAPEAAASILWRDAALAPEAAATMRITAQDLLEFGLIDAIVDEPPGGAHADRGAAAATVKSALLAQLGALDAAYGRRPDLDVRRLLADRGERYRRIGVFEEGSAHARPDGGGNGTAPPSGVPASSSVE